jgi:hypothetical protein
VSSFDPLSAADAIVLTAPDSSIRSLNATAGRITGWTSEDGREYAHNGSANGSLPTGRSRRVPILLFSADDPLKQAKLGGAAGCSEYLSKPATKAEVLRALKFFGSHPSLVS